MATQYTYADVEKLIKDNNLYFSDADLSLARNNPNAGMTIGNYKIDYANATTDDQRALANAGAEQTRKDYGNYTGGTDGSRYYLYEPTPLSYNDGGFENPYQSRYDEALNNVLNQQEWSYNPETDQAYQAARQQYLREADRAQQDTLGQMASMTGGIASTAAMNAASQAGDYYRSQLNDMLGAYIDRDYQRRVDTKAENFDIVSMLNDLRNQARSEYDTDRNFGYNQWTDELGFRSDEEQTKYDREWAEEARDYEREQYKTEYGDALSLDLYTSLMQDYENSGNADALKRARAILTALYNAAGYGG